MATNREVISDIVGSLRALNIDDRISNRLILSKLKDKAQLIIKQDLDSRRLFKITDVWKRINCFSLCEAKPIECGCDIVICDTIMKSVKKIPDIYDSNFGKLIKILSINGDNEIIQTTIHGYKEIKNREVKNKNQKYFWIDNEYIYIPNSMIEEVMIVALFKNPDEVDKLNGEDVDNCKGPLDEKFVCPEHLIDVIKTATINELAGVYKRIVEDERPDLNTNTKA